MTNDDLVHAASEPDLSQNGQLNAVPTGKTMGQIASAVYARSFGLVSDFYWAKPEDPEPAAMKAWEAAANAVIEECANVVLQAAWSASPEAIAAKLRSLKSSPGRVVDRSALPNDGDQRETKNLIRGEE
jgi:hypothetical protein